MRVALYARVSSESQQARGTIGSQLEVLRARIAGEGHELVAEFCDDGFSGARLDRPGLDAMRDQAEAGVFEAVWCLSPDRLARAYVYQVLVLDELAQLGVRVVFADAPAIDDDDPQLRLLTQVQGVIAEYERAKIGERNRRGRLYRARAGEVVSWRAPYGYRRVPRDGTGPARLEIFETEAAMVRRIYDDYLSGGHSIREIVRRLNADNIPTPTDRAQWWHSTVCRILTNEAYIGRVYFNQTETVTTLRNGRHSRTQRRRPREDWIAIPCPSIIDDTAFEAAQKVSRDNSKWSPRNLPEDVEAWLLRRLVRCGPCDLALGCQKIVSPEGKVHRYYWCPNHADARVARQQRCPERNIRADTLDDFVFEQVRAALLRPDVLLAGQTALTAATPVPDDELLTVELSRIDRKLVANRAERRRLADLYQSGLLELTEVQQRARDIDARHCALTEQHEGLISQRHQLATDNQLRGRVTDFAQRAAAGIDKLGFNERQQLMRLVVEHVRVTGWQVEIQLRIPFDDGPGPPDTPPGGPPHTGDNSAKVTPRSTQPRQRTHQEQMSTKDGLRSLRGMRVTEERRQQRHVSVNVDAGAIPVEQRPHRETVAQVMRPGLALALLFEAGALHKVTEGPVEDTDVDPGAGRREQEARHFWMRTELVPEPDIAHEAPEGRRVQGNRPALLELRGPHRQDPLLPVHVVVIEANRLAGSHPGDSQQPDKGLVGSCPLWQAKGAGRGHEPNDVGVGVQVGGDPTAPIGQEPRGRDLGIGVDRLQVPGQAADHRESLRPPHWRARRRLGRPGHGQLGGDAGRAPSFQVGDEVGEQPTVLLQLVTEGPVHGEVVLCCLAERAHAAPPGQASASGRS